MATTITSGHLAILYISDPTGVAFAGPEAMTDDGTHKVFTITDTVKRIWSPTAAITPTWTLGPTGTITKNRLAGALYSTVDESANLPVTTAGTYLPMAALLYARDFSVTLKKTLADTAALECTTPPVYLTKKPVIKSLTGTLNTFFTPDAIATFGGAVTNYMADAITDDLVFAIELYVSANYTLRMWAKVDSENIKATLENVLEETVSFTGYPDVDGRVISQI